MKHLFAAIISLIIFSTAVYAQDSFYMEYAMVIGQSKEGFKTSNKTWHSALGTRLESEMNLPGLGLKKTIMIMPKSNPDMIYTIDEEKKSYTEIKQEADINDSEAYTVEIIGQEKVAGYNCTHAKVKTMGQVFEIWTTKEIDGYKELYNQAMLQKQSFGMDKAMRNNEQLMGIIVRVKNDNKKESFTMELVKFEKGNYPASMFQIPAGYTKGMSFDPSQMQNMSPEERQKMLEEMIKQYGTEEKD